MSFYNISLSKEKSSPKRAASLKTSCSPTSASSSSTAKTNLELNIGNKLKTHIMNKPLPHQNHANTNIMISGLTDGISSVKNSQSGTKANQQFLLSRNRKSVGAIANPSTNDTDSTHDIASNHISMLNTNNNGESNKLILTTSSFGKQSPSIIDESNALHHHQTTNGTANLERSSYSHSPNIACYNKDDVVVLDNKRMDLVIPNSNEGGNGHDDTSPNKNNQTFDFGGSSGDCHQKPRRTNSIDKTSLTKTKLSFLSSTKLTLKNKKQPLNPTRSESGDIVKYLTQSQILLSRPSSSNHNSRSKALKSFNVLENTMNTNNNLGYNPSNHYINTLHATPNSKESSSSCIISRNSHSTGAGRHMNQLIICQNNNNNMENSYICPSKDSNNNIDQSPMSLLPYKGNTNMDNKYSNLFIQRMSANEQNRLYSKKYGMEIYQTTKQKKNLSEQIASLENRIKRLEYEENLMKKRIEETSKKTCMIIQSKQRHQQKITSKINKKIEDENNIQAKKQYLNHKRMEDKTILQYTKDRTLQEKRDIVNIMKIENQFNRMIKNEIEKKISEKHQVKIEEIKVLESSLRNTQLEKENCPLEKLNQKYNEKLEKEKHENMLMEQKLNDLEKVEHELFERLSNTYMIHKSKFEELEKIYNIDVNKLGSDNETLSDLVSNNKGMERT